MATTTQVPTSKSSSPTDLSEPASSTATGSSPLSDPRSVEPAYSTPADIASVAIENGQQTDANTIVTGPNVSSGEDESSDDLGGTFFKCPHCIKTYATDHARNRHLRDKKSLCARARVQDNSAKWCCPRCHAQMQKKYSVERHIKDSCWKICDQCCEAGNDHCNANFDDGDCTHCINDGLLCTKHTEAIPDCAAEILTDQPAEPRKPGPKAKRQINSSRPKREKRPAANSPETSPQFKHVSKRASTIVKEERTVRRHLKGELAQEDMPGRALRRRVTAPLPPISSPDMEVQALHIGREHVSSNQADSSSAPQSNMLSPQQAQERHSNSGRFLPPPVGSIQGTGLQSASLGQWWNHPTDLPSFPKAMADPFMPSGLPNMANHVSYGAPPPGFGSSVNMDQIMQQMLARQQQHVYNMAMAASNGPNSGAAHISRLPGNQAPVGANYCRGALQDVHAPEPRVGRFRPAQVGNFQIHEDGLGASQTEDRRETFLASAPGPCMPSRQSPVDVPQDTEPRALPRKPTFEQLRKLDRMPCTSVQAQSRSHAWVQESKPPQLAPIPRTISQDADSNDPMLTLRLHSNIFDINGNAVFSILSIRYSQKFGPRLEAYCQRRQKEYSVDWVFVYRWHVPGKPGQKSLLITYDMTPKDIKDDEYPHMAVANMDTIFVMRAPSSRPADIENNNNQTKVDEAPALTPVSSPLPRQDVAITNGETQTYQAAAVNAAWLTHCEANMAALTNHADDLTATIARQTHQLAQQQNAITTLQNCNAYLYRKATELQQARLPTAHQPSTRPATGAQRAPTSQQQAPSFLSRLESVRDPVAHPPFDPLYFPSFATGEHDLPGFQALPFFQSQGQGHGHGHLNHGLAPPQYMPPQRQPRVVHDVAAKVAARPDDVVE